jgi:hypothetical protein
MAPRSASEKVRTKKSYFSSAWEYVTLPFSLRLPKNQIVVFLAVTRVEKTNQKHVSIYFRVVA